MHGRESPSVCFVISAARCLYDEDHACSRDTNTRGRTLTVSNSEIPNPLPNPPGGARGAFTALSQFSGAAQGIPYQGGAQPMPAPQAWGQPSPYAAAPRPKRPPLSTRVRVCLRLELILSVIALVNLFIPYLFDDLSIYFERFTSVWFYESVISYIMTIVLSAVALQKRSKAVRYAMVGVVLVSFLLMDPVLAVLEGGTWYWLFLPPTLDPSVFGDHWYASLLVVRGVLIWLIVRSGLIIAIVLAVPDRRPSASTPVGAPFGAPVGYYPHAAAPAQPASPQGAPMPVSTIPPAPPQGAPVHVAATQPLPPQEMPVQTPSPTLAPPSGAPAVPGTPDGSTQTAQ